MNNFQFIWRVSVIALLAVAGNAFAQAELLEAEEKAKEAEKKAARKGRWEKILESIRDENRDKVIRHLAVVISEIERSSKLEKPQVLKLEVGAKGAADKAVEEWIANLERQEGLIQNLEAMAGNIPENDVEKGDDQQNVNFDQIIAQWGRQLQPSVAENQGLWSATLDKTLNEEQKKAWELSKLQRTEFNKSLQIAQAVQMADAALRLTNDQRQQLFELMINSGKAPNAEDEDNGANQQPVVIQGNGQVIIRQQIRAGGGVVRIVGNANNNNTGTAPSLQSLDRSKVAEFLSEAQMARWDDLMKAPNQGRNGNMWMGNQLQMFNGNIIINQ